jgi:hypothetical protein
MASGLPAGAQSFSEEVEADTSAVGQAMGVIVLSSLVGGIEKGSGVFLCMDTR